MKEQTKPQTPAETLEHPFGKPGEHNKYAVFPDELENDPTVFFHGTERRVLEAIREEGFAMPSKPKAQSVSFSRTSGLALGYACEKRSNASPEGVVIAVRFNADNRSLVRSEQFGIHVDRFDPQPEIVRWRSPPTTPTPSAAR